MMLLGLLLIAVALADPNESEVVSGSTTTAPTAIAPGVAPGTTAPLGFYELGNGTAPQRLGRAPLRGFGEVQATITSSDGTTCQVCLLAATTPDQQARGLMEVTDEYLGGYDGMYFEYPDEVQGAFWMRNTPLPLSIAYFDEAGELVSTSDMDPCEDSPECERYPADGPFRFAIEVVQGQLSRIGIDEGATLLVTGRTCPLPR